MAQPQLNQGQGRCFGTAQMHVTPVRAVIELGAYDDVLAQAMGAVHHANRHAALDDFIALAFPAMRAAQGEMVPGEQIQLIGSASALDVFYRLEGVQQLIRRGMIVPPAIEAVSMQVGEPGVGFVRYRRNEKRASGWVRRERARAERRGVSTEKLSVRSGRSPNGDSVRPLGLPCGNAMLNIRRVDGAYTDDPLFVSTYGLSAASSPSILPITPLVSEDL